MGDPLRGKAIPLMSTIGFGDKGYTNLLTRALKDVNEKCETIPDPVQLEYHLPHNLIFL